MEFYDMDLLSKKGKYPHGLFRMIGSLLIGFLSCFYLPHATNAQLVIDTNLTPEKLVNEILTGGDVQVSNVQFSKGDAVQRGSFDAANANAGLPGGVLFATGDISLAIGPNDKADATYPDDYCMDGGICGPGDPDIDRILPNGTDSYDAAVLEFDFVPSGDFIDLEYVFASEEYPEYTCSAFTDLFGFFLSGPGINGPYSNDSKNIAKVPGQDTAVGINTINKGPGKNGNGECDGDCPCNPDLYVENPQEGDLTDLQYDGYTVPLTAGAAVECGKTYHIKLVIADAGDGKMDSGVLLKSGSFSVKGGGVDVEGNSISGDSVITEGCTEGQFTFRVNDSTEADTIGYSIGGSATEGKDYPEIGDSVVVPAGETSTSLKVDPIPDSTKEGPENVTVTAEIDACGETFPIKEELWILDEVVIDSVDVNPSSCGSEGANLTVHANEGDQRYQYSIDGGVDYQASNTFENLSGGSYNVFVENANGCTDSVSIFIDQPDSLALSGTVTNESSPGASDGAIDLTVNGGVQPYSYKWSNGDTVQDPSGLSAGSYTVVLTDSKGCQDSATFYVGTATDVEDLLAVDDGVVLYPNPVKEKLKVSLPDGHDLDGLRVINLLGESVLSSVPVAHDPVNLVVEELEPGTFFLQTLDGELIGRFVVSR